MSNEVTVFENQDFEELAKLTGAYVGSSYIPILKVNRNAEDDDGRSLPMGSYCIMQDTNMVFGKPVIFRPFINAYQYIEYSPADNKFVNKSIIVKNFNEEPLDEQGGMACGKVSKEILDSLSEKDREKQKNIKCNRHMYGLATFDGIDADKNPVQISNLPVLLKLAGSNFMAPRDALAAITKMKHQFFQHNLTLTTNRKKNGSNIYYEVVVQPNLKEDIRFTEEDYATFMLFQDIIDKENKSVAAKWRNAKKMILDKVDIHSELELNDPIDDLING